MFCRNGRNTIVFAPSPTSCTLNTRVLQLPDNDPSGSIQGCTYCALDQVSDTIRLRSVAFSGSVTGQLAATAVLMMIATAAKVNSDAQRGL